MTVSVFTIQLEGVEWTLSVDTATGRIINSPNGKGHITYNATLTAPEVGE
tara:strand:+ start:811 stop:960 length:150 start_codon:yes stop_codon:yes gene_type:complete